MIIAGPRNARFGAPRRTARDGVDLSLRTRVRALRGAVSDVFGVPVDALPPADPAAIFTAEAASELARLCVGRSSIWAVTGEGPAVELLALALDLEQLALELQDDDLASRTHRLGECAAGLARLRRVPTTSDLIEAAAAEIVERCGFGRVVVSRVDSGAWVPVTAHFASADADWFGDFAGQAIPLHGSTPEARILTERAPAVVADTSSGSMHREIIVDAGQSSSYVVAPMIIDGDVIGFIHADHFPENRRADVADRDILSAFATGLARTHERLTLIERVRAQRSSVEQVLGHSMRGLAEATEVTVVGSGTQLVAQRSEALAELTARERDVLSLMVEGATNQQIARQLLIAPDTVKSHVKQILRKFGVTNRAQAIACAAGTALL